MPTVAPVAPAAVDPVAQILRAAMSAVGVMYQWGGNSLATGVDCSGLVQQAFLAAGYQLPRTTFEQVNLGQSVDYLAAKAGDLIFYDTKSGGKNAHVAIYLGNGQMLEAPRTGQAVRVTDVRNGGKFKRVVGQVGKGEPQNVEMGAGKYQSLFAAHGEAQKQRSAFGIPNVGELFQSEFSDREAIAGLGAGGPGDTGMKLPPNRSTGAIGGLIGAAGSKATTRGSLTLGDAYKFAVGAGATPEEARTLAAIAMAESGLNPYAHNPNASTGDNSYGLWQINMLGDMGTSRRQQFGLGGNEELFDPTTNAKAALGILRGQGFGAWSVYKSGAYKQYLNQLNQGKGG